MTAAARDQLDVDVLLSPHHGSRTSNSREFLEAASPAYLVVSASRGFGANTKQPGFLEELCRQQGIKLLTTARDGTICFTTDGRSLAVGQGFLIKPR
jgi:competence protein ComEC